MKTVVIIQARLGSKRLPAKVLKKVSGKSILARVIDRAQRIPDVDEVVCAFPKGSQLLTRIAKDKEIRVFLGSEDDVLSRYYGAAKAFEADIIVRITADCPLIDSEICGKVVALRKSEQSGYSSNVWPRSFPKGLDCECFTFEMLEKANKTATEQQDREHVTPWIVRNTPRVNLASGRFDLSNMRWTLDYPEDLQFIEAVFAHGTPKNIEEVLEILRKNPEIEKLNAMHVEKAA